MTQQDILLLYNRFQMSKFASEIERLGLPDALDYFLEYDKQTVLRNEDRFELLMHAMEQRGEVFG